MAAPYHIISKNHGILYKDKGSKFFAFCFFVASEQDIKLHLLALKKEHPSATHHCYAWVLGSDKQITRANDDGEPGNTAGKPILAQIQSKGLINCLVVVVRYFGGTLLGVNGLINAYKSAAAEVLAAAEIQEFYPLKVFKIECDATQLSKVMRSLKQLDAKILSQDFNAAYEIQFQLKAANENALTEALKENYSVKLIELNSKE